MFNTSNFTHQNPPKPRTIEELYPDFTPEERDEAKDTLRRYLDLVWRIYQRVRHETDEKIDENQFKR